MPSSQQHECRKYIGLVCRVKNAGSFLFGIPCWDNSDLEARGNVFVMNGFAFVVFRSNESRTVAAYGKVLLRHIQPLIKRTRCRTITSLASNHGPIVSRRAMQPGRYALFSTSSRTSLSPL